MIRLNHWAQAVNRLDAVSKELKAAGVFINSEFNQRVVHVLHDLTVIYTCELYQYDIGYPNTLDRLETLCDLYESQLERHMGGAGRTLEERMRDATRRLLVLEHELQMRQLAKVNWNE